MSKWTINDISRQTGKLAVVTGTGGLGYETALALAGSGAEVIIAGRSEVKGQDATQKIIGAYRQARVRFEQIDLADLGSVAAFASRLTAANRGIDLLINNAGVMAPPTRRTTADGFELQFGTNYLGHFALTARLLPLLRKSLRPRVINLSSGAHRMGASIHFDDLHWERAYKAWPAYAQSKLAMLMFALELQRKCDANGWGLMSNAAHPGFARTELIANGPGSDALLSKISGVLRPFMSQSAAAGALPTLFAATSPEAEGGAYYGPDGFYEMKGAPAPAYIAPPAKDELVARRLWEVSEHLTGVNWSAKEIVKA